MKSSDTHILLREAALAQASIEFPQHLPITERLDEISSLIQQHQVVIIAGETGSGKTTQIPKLCIKLGRGRAGLIGHTQPRRLAARSIAHRLSDELGTSVGEAVGYKIRFQDKLAPGSAVKLMTDGILLAEIQRDKLLRQYDTIILDEAHERSLNIDFLLGYLKTILPKRPDLKLIITSATIEQEKFSDFFHQAPSIAVSGRTYPVDIQYLSNDLESQNFEMRLPQLVVQSVQKCLQQGPGDILVFLSGERDIREVSKALKAVHDEKLLLLPLYARLNAKEQAKIFQSSKKTKVVLATNIAETSLTIPGIKYVIDSGLARVSRYNMRSKVQRLLIEKIAKASAKQRAGRCGRVSAGVCFRLYSEADFDARPDYTDPEILRTNLAAIILQMKALKIGDIYAFPFIDAPLPKNIRAGFKNLFELQAIDEQQRITKLGYQFARLPIDPSYAAIVFAATKLGVLHEALVLVSFLSIPDPRDRRQEVRDKAKQLFQPFIDKQSEFIEILNIWHHLKEASEERSKRNFKQYCLDMLLSPMRILEWFDLYRQLKTNMTTLGYKISLGEPDYAQIHQALISGLVTHVAHYQDEKGYLLPQNQTVAIFPGSSLNKKPKWLLSASYIMTSKLYAHMNAMIQPQWLEQQAKHLLKYSYQDPHWDAQSGYVVAYEKVTLYNHVLVGRRRINYHRVQPEQARNHFIREALVPMCLDIKLPFYVHNRDVIESIRLLERKLRKSDVFIDDESIAAFYQGVLPEDMHNTRALLAYAKKHPQETTSWMMSQADMMKQEADELVLTRFPDNLVMRDHAFALEYDFQPGQGCDGVSVIVPIHLLDKVDEETCHWLVPGLLEEKIIALMKSLPKSVRTSFVPVPDYARAVYQALTPYSGDLLCLLQEKLRRMNGTVIKPEHWQLEKLPLHCQMNVKVVDSDGELIAQGRDLKSLRSNLQQEVEANVQAIAQAQERHEISSWDFGDIPASTEIQQDAHQVTVYPALVDQQTAVSLLFHATPTMAQEKHRAGLTRLAMLSLANEMNYLRKNIPDKKSFKLLAQQIAPVDALIDDLLFATCLENFFADKLLYRQQDFLDNLSQRKAQLTPCFNQYAAVLITSLKVRLKIMQCRNNAQVAREVDALFCGGFLHQTPFEWLQRFPIYLKGLLYQLEKPLPVARTTDYANQIDKWLEKYHNAVEESKRTFGCATPALQRFRWLIEEFRVSLFAQHLKTKLPVSKERLNKYWQETQKR